MMQLRWFVEIIVLLTSISTVAAMSQFSPDPYNTYDTCYEEKVRTNLGSFHVNLSNGNYTANGPMASVAMQWNANGKLQIGRQNFVSSLGGIDVSFHGIQVPDRYQVVDGNVGAVLYSLHGTQTAELNGIPNLGKRIDITGSELMVFDKDALLDHLYTIEEVGRLVQQITGQQDVTGTHPNVTLIANPQTSPNFRVLLRQKMAMIHANFNTGKNKNNAVLVTPDVQINADTMLSMGSQAFVDFVSSWQQAFPDMVIRDDYILADGHQGAIEYVWEGSQTGPYKAVNGTVLPPSAQSVRVRNLMFLDFNDEGLITKVTNVHDEAAILTQIQLPAGSFLYP